MRAEMSMGPQHPEHSPLYHAFVHGLRPASRNWLDFDEAATQAKWGLADSIAHLLGHLVQKAGADANYIREVRNRLDRAHAHTGGHH